MDEDKYMTWKGHNKVIPSTIIGKEIYPVADNPLYIGNSFSNKINMRENNLNKHISQNSKYKFKDITFRMDSFIEFSLINNDE